LLAAPTVTVAKGYEEEVLTESEDGKGDGVDELVVGELIVVGRVIAAADVWL